LQQLADELVHTVREHLRTQERRREQREESAVSSHLAAAAAAAAAVASGGTGGFSARVDAVPATAAPDDEDDVAAQRVRSQIAVYTLRLLQAAARQLRAATGSPEALERELAEHEMPRIHGSAWVSAWHATFNFNRWQAEHNPMIAMRSKAPSSPVLIAAVKDTMKAGLLDFRQSLRESVGAKLGIRKAMKSRFSAFLSGKRVATRGGGWMVGINEGGCGDGLEYAAR
jgi:hypothetical protein